MLVTLLKKNLLGYKWFCQIKINLARRVQFYHDLWDNNLSKEWIHLRVWHNAKAVIQSLSENCISSDVERYQKHF